jgi:DNA-binding transcriptional regulator WhiA
MLTKEAGNISATKDLKKQREYFAGLSSNMATVARSFKLSNQPVYLQYCPMKKASWLSSEKQIKNPYYGSSMLTCGAVTETL